MTKEVEVERPGPRKLCFTYHRQKKKPLQAGRPQLQPQPLRPRKASQELWVKLKQNSVLKAKNQPHKQLKTWPLPKCLCVDRRGLQTSLIPLRRVALALPRGKVSTTCPSHPKLLKRPYIHLPKGSLYNLFKAPQAALVGGDLHLRCEEELVQLRTQP